MRDEANENFRKVAISLAQRAREPGTAGFLFTSAIRGEGTTTTVLNVAGHLRRSCGMRPLIVELNAHRPAMARLLGLDTGRSLQAVADSRLDARECIQATSLDVPVLPAARNGRHIELTIPTVLSRILSEVGGDYDVILADAPSVLDHADALAAATVIPRTVLVVEAGRTRYEVVERARRDLEAARATVVGAVLNKHKRYIPKWAYRMVVR